MMKPDDEMRRRFSGHRDISNNIDTDAARAALDQSNSRRANLRRGLGVSALLGVLVGVLFAAANLTTSDPSEIETADDETPATSIAPIDEPRDTTTPTSITSPTLAPGVATSTALVAVDVDGVVRINEAIWKPNVDNIDPPVQIQAVAGASGMLLLETTGGVYGVNVENLDTPLSLLYSAPDARLLDVSEPLARSIIDWTIPDSDSLDGEVVGVEEFAPGGVRGRGFFQVEPFGGEVVSGSLGSADNAHILLTVEDLSGECTRNIVTDLDGNLSHDTGCHEHGIGAWSEANLVVEAGSGQQDDWTIIVSGPEGDFQEVQFPGAFQPRHIDVHTSADGRTEALILGTGEELVYVDVDRFLAAEDPKSAVISVSTTPKLVSARFVSGLPQHGFGQPPIPEEVSVHIVAGVAADDVLNVRSGPGTENSIAFELAPNATGVVSLGLVAQSLDGGLWVQIYNPRSGQEDDSGWVNTAFLRPQNVPDSRPCLFNGPQDHYVWSDRRSDQAGQVDSDATIVGNIDTYRFGGCIRTVIDLDTGYSEDGVRSPANGLPTDILVTRESPIRIDFGESLFAAEDADARLNESDGRRFESFVSVDIADGLIGELFMPSEVVDVKFDSDRARIVIDVADLGRPEFDVGAAETLLSDDVVITAVMVDNDRFTISGLARPFEASLGLAVRIGDDPVTVEFVDTFVGPGDQYSETSVMTTSWAEAWGRFEFSMFLDEDEVDRLILDFDPSGGAADEPTILSVPLGDLTEFSQSPE